LIGLEVMTPYLLRRNRLSEKLGTVKYGAKLSYLKRLCGAQARQASAAGLSIATLGLAGMLAQGVLRLYLQDTKLAGRKVNRMWLNG